MTTPLPEVSRAPVPDDLDDALKGALAAHVGPDGRFFNPWHGPMTFRSGDLLKWKLGSRTGRYAELKRTRPYTPDVREGALAAFAAQGAPLRVMWLGHASYLVGVGETRLVIDPIFGGAGPVVPRKAPHPFAPRELERLDAVLLTHGHYDHCDVPSLKRLAASHPDALFVTPLGLSNLLPRGVRRLELDWWDQFELGDARITFTPSQHWHRRGLFDLNAALWGGWFIRGAGRAFYHPGDSGWFPELAAARAILGTPDLLALPLGAFAPRWFMSPQHMDPAGALELWRAIGAPQATPMHWGTFDLSDEPLDQGLVEFDELLSGGPPPPGELVTLAHGETLGVG